MRESGRRAAATLGVSALMAVSGTVSGVATSSGSAGSAGGASAPPSPGTSQKSSPGSTKSAPRSVSPFAGRAMWIWELPLSSGGSAQAIVAKARANGIRTVFIKSSDGSSPWGQFSPALVAALKHGGLRVCAWQYVYGRYPTSEAALGARAVRLGAQCLVIDAETEYEGRYASAQRYLQALRQRVGQRFPVALAGFPYVDYHPAFPYSVFLGPGGAQYNAPQMYWKDIGVSVDQVYQHTYLENSVYARTIVPLGQLYSSPRSADIRRFRVLASAYGAPGLSWWDWQEALPYAWRALSGSLTHAASVPAAPGPVALGRGARGDLVVWAQEHLRAAHVSTAVDGVYGMGTQQAVASFQRAHGLRASGRIDAGSWRALLRYPAAAVSWTTRSASSRTATAAAAASGSAPRSATLPPVRNEIRPKDHRPR